MLGKKNIQKSTAIVLVASAVFFSPWIGDLAERLFANFPKIVKFYAYPTENDNALETAEDNYYINNLNMWRARRMHQRIEDALNSNTVDLQKRLDSLREY